LILAGKARSDYPAVHWSSFGSSEKTNGYTHPGILFHTLDLIPLRRSGRHPSVTHLIRTADGRDANRIARLVNAAFQVEAFFKIGDRTSERDIHDLLKTGAFLVVDGDADDEALAACVYCSIEGTRAYFGMLSVDPARQGTGLGRALIAAAESRARAAGCDRMEIHVVNLREELPPLYRRFGYVESGTLPFSDTERASMPCYFIVMQKTL
jgi:GNAT superfamily N-acetyltransferase